MRLDEFKIDKPKASDTMGITRDKMPQVKSDDYEDYKKYLKDNCLERVQIQVDGGIKLHNAQEVISAGGDILVAGSEVFGSKKPSQVIKDFYANARSIKSI